MFVQEENNVLSTSITSLLQRGIQMPSIESFSDRHPDICCLPWVELNHVRQL